MYIEMLQAILLKTVPDFLQVIADKQLEKKLKIDIV